MLSQDIENEGEIDNKKLKVRKEHDENAVPSRALTIVYPVCKSIYSLRHVFTDQTKIVYPSFTAYYAPKELRPLPMINNLEDMIYENQF